MIWVCKECQKIYKPTGFSGGFCSTKCRFWSKVDKTPGHGPNGSCWVWTAKKNKNGYGLLGSVGKWVSAHRFSYELHKNSIPPGLQIRHSCDNPPCVNPFHLDVGTVKDNVEDCVNRDRKWVGRGELSPTVKLSNRDVKTIREAYSTGGFTQLGLSRVFNVSKTQINNIVNKREWK